MKNQIRSFVMGAGLAALLSSPMLVAQTAETAEIPFDFHAGKLNLSAGTYAVAKVMSSGVLQLRNEDTNSSIFLGPQGRHQGKDNDAKLAFRCYSGDCFLSEISIPGSPAYTFWKTDHEKELENGGAKLAMAYVPLATR